MELSTHFPEISIFIWQWLAHLDDAKIWIVCPINGENHTNNSLVFRLTYPINDDYKFWYLSLKSNINSILLEFCCYKSKFLIRSKYCRGYFNRVDGILSILHDLLEFGEFLWWLRIGRCWQTAEPEQKVWQLIRLIWALWQSDFPIRIPSVSLNQFYSALIKNFT